MKARTNGILAGVLALSLLLPAGCATNPDGSKEYKRTAIGALAGAALGAGTGALVGGKSHRGTGALVGGAVGALAGGGIGNYMDRQAAAMKASVPEAQVERQGDKLYVNLPSGILFDTGSDAVKADARGKLQEAAGVLKQYPDTYITVEGHTDSTGKPDLNQKLSERRAANVKAVLVEGGVPAGRLNVVGYGSTRPVADNATPDGRSQNRRVQLEIRPNEALQQQAQQPQG